MQKLVCIVHGHSAFTMHTSTKSSEMHSKSEKYISQEKQESSDQFSDDGFKDKINSEGNLCVDCLCAN